MIDLYTRPDPDGHKVQIMLEECGLAHAIHVLNPHPSDDLPSRYVSICADLRAPAIMDHDSPDGRPMPVSQAAAILIYLAGKTGRFLPKADRDRFKMLEWLIWSDSLASRPGSDSLADDDENAEPPCASLLTILDTQLGKTRAFVAGRQFTIADIAIFSDCLARLTMPAQFEPYANLKRWFDAVLARSAVKRAIVAMTDANRRALASNQMESRLRGGGLEAR